MNTMQDLMQRLGPHLDAIARTFKGQAECTLVVTLPDQEGCFVVSNNQAITNDHNILIKKLQENEGADCERGEATVRVQ